VDLALTVSPVYGVVLATILDGAMNGERFARFVAELAGVLDRKFVGQRFVLPRLALMAHAAHPCPRCWIT
jgi:hypothetical protein